MWPFDTFCDPMWRPMASTLLHFVWQGIVVAALWMVLFRCVRGYRKQVSYLLGLVGMFVMAACPVATFVLLESDTRRDTVPLSSVDMPNVPVDVFLSSTVASDLPVAPIVSWSAVAWPSTPSQWIDVSQPYLIGGWIVGLAILSGRLLMGAIGARRLRRDRQAISADLADCSAALAARIGLRRSPGLFSSKTVREAVVTGFLRPIVLLPVAWLTEMTPEVLEAVIAHELAHIRRFDLWVNLFQRLVETLLFYHPAVWWMSRRVRLAREMCCDELAAAATGERVVYATALELAARKRLEPERSFFEVALGVTKMTLLNRVQNVLGLAVSHEKGRWWPAALLTLLVPPAVWLASTATITSAQEEKPAEELQSVPQEGRGIGEAILQPMAQQPKYTANALLRVAIEAKPIIGGKTVVMHRDWFEIYKATQKQLLLSRFVLLAALRKPEVAKLPSIRREQARGDVEKWLAGQLRITFPGDAEIMEVSLTSDNAKEAAALVNAAVFAYLNEVVNAERDKKRQHLSELDRAFVEKENEMRRKREDLKKLAEMLGTSDTGTLTVQQKLAMELLTLYRRDAANIRSKLREKRAELAGQENMLLNPAEQPLKRMEIRGLKAYIAHMHEQEQSMRKLVDKQQREVEQIGSSSVEIEMVRADINNLGIVLTSIATERERLRVEIRAVPRVTLLQRADVPESPDR